MYLQPARPVAVLLAKLNHFSDHIVLCLLTAAAAAQAAATQGAAAQAAAAGGRRMWQEGVGFTGKG
jgi:hypothetical protein